MFRIFKNRARGIGVCVAAFVLGMAFFELLPSLVQNSIQKLLVQKNLPVSLKVRDIGLWGCDFSEIVAGGQNPFVRVGSVRLDYSPVDLLRKKLSRITLSGVDLNLQVKDGKYMVPWQSDHDSRQPESEPTRTIEDYVRYLAVLGEISIDHARINLFWDHTSFSIPCSLTVRTKQHDAPLVELRAELMLRGQQLTGAVEFNLDTMEMRIETAADSVDLTRFADLIRTENFSDVSGRLGVTAEALVGLKPFSIISAKVAGKIAQPDVTLQSIRISGISTPQEQPFRFTFTADKSSGRLRTNSLAVAGPIDAEVGGLDLLFSSTDKGFSFDGNVSVAIYEQKISARLVIAPTEFVSRVFGETGENGDWQLQAIGVNPPEVRFSGAGIDLSAQKTDYTLKATSGEGRPAFAYKVELSTLKFDTDNFSAQMPQLSLRGETSNGNSSFVLPFEDLSVSDNGGVSATGRGEIRLHWPYRSGIETSKVSFDPIQLNDLELGSFQMDLKQEQSGFDIAGRFQSALIDAFCIDLNGQAEETPAGPDIEIDFHNSCDRSMKDFDLGRFSAALSGFFADAELNVTGNMSYKNGRFLGTVDSQGENVRITSAEKEFFLEGGRLDLHLTELPRIKSSPKQTISFQSLKYGKITANNGLVEFQIESPESVFIEKGAVGWSDGHVYTQAFRFSPKKRDYDLTVFCDRLNFAKVLEQLGAATADGQGRVNGRVPVRITDGRFFVENGFLYSTPGEGGKIKLTKMAMLTKGIPENSPQFAQIDLAREALKDFSYDWTKLDINSESADDLFLHLQINGKPANPLPFVYSREFGGFTRVEASNPGSKFQGIKLDVNFRLPLNQVLHYGNSMKAILK